MNRRVLFIMLLVCIFSCSVLAQVQTGQRGQRRMRIGRAGQRGTRPSKNNERGLRELTAEEIPPNLNFYAMDPLYNPDAVLGWAEERIEEKLNRGMLAISMEEGKVYLGWRLLKTDPKNIAFNVYRSTAKQAPVKLNSQPLTKTTDFVDEKAPLDQANAWFVKPVVNGREKVDSERAALPANPPVQQYKSLPLRNDVRASMVGIADLNGDSVYDFVVKHSSGRGKDPGRISPNSGAGLKNSLAKTFVTGNQLKTLLKDPIYGLRVLCCCSTPAITSGASFIPTTTSPTYPPGD